MFKNYTNITVEDKLVFTGHLGTEEAENDGVLAERVSTGDHAFRTSTQRSPQHPAPCIDADKGKN